MAGFWVLCWYVLGEEVLGFRWVLFWVVCFCILIGWLLGFVFW